MSRRDINDYANELLLDFLDAFHAQLKADLESLYADEWLERGVKSKFKADYFERTRQMLESPMRVVDMEKTDEEIFGVEHLWNIISAHWKDLYESRFENRERTQVYLGEIAEVRHNVSHRRRRHFLRRSELTRFAQNCAILLRSIGSNEAQRFERVAESLSAGSTPWGTTLGGYLPPQDDVCEEFVGRPTQLRDLSGWLASDAPQLLVWGYGGAGKSALAYEFARETKEIAPSSLEAVCWVSAKKEEYVGGEARPRRADFGDRATFRAAVFNAMYEAEAGELNEEELLEHLSEMPILLVVDDFDTVLQDEELVEFLMHDIRGTGTRVLYTSRQKVVGLRSIEVLGFDGAELEDFVRLRAFEHDLDPDPCAERAEAIHSVTGGFPLFIDDLLRYSRLTGIKEALEDWSQRKGDAAREYALRRQLEQLGEVARNVLMALSVSNGPLTTLELATLAGVTDDDAENAVRDLLGWRLLNRVAGDDESRPGFSMNLNTRRLVQRTYGHESRMEGFRSRFRVLGSKQIPAARSAAIGSAIGIARSLVIRGDAESAIGVLKERMTGELADSPDLVGVLGWAYSRMPTRFLDEARETFERAYELGNTKEDTYFHWASLERDQAESAVGRVRESDLLEAWRRCSRAAEIGMKVCGVTKALCQLAGYARAREAKTLERMNEFTQATGAYAEAVSLFQRAFNAPSSPVKDIPRGLLYRGLVIAQEAMGDLEGVQATLSEWVKVSGGDDFYAAEYRRVTSRFPALAYVTALQPASSA